MNRLGVALTLSMAAAACAGKDAANADSTASVVPPPVAAAAAAPTQAPPTAAAVAAPPVSRVDERRHPAAPMVSAGFVRGQIPRGATATLRAETRVCTNTSRVGEEVFATVVEPVRGSHDVAIPAGARVKMRVTVLRLSPNVKDPVTIGFEIETVAFGDHDYPLSAIVTDEKIEAVRDQAEPNGARRAGGRADTMHDGCIPQGSMMKANMMAPLDIR